MTQEFYMNNEGQVFDKPPAQVDHEKSLRSAEQKTVDGVCPLCGEGWIAPGGKLNRRLYAGERAACTSCHREIIAVPSGPALRTPEMVENPWMKAERLEKELAGAKQEIEYLTLSREDAIKRGKQFEIACKATTKELMEWTGIAERLEKDVADWAKKCRVAEDNLSAEWSWKKHFEESEKHANRLIGDLHDMQEDYIREKAAHQNTRYAMWLMGAGWFLLSICWIIKLIRENS